MSVGMAQSQSILVDRFIDFPITYGSHRFLFKFGLGKIDSPFKRSKYDSRCIQDLVLAKLILCSQNLTIFFKIWNLRKKIVAYNLEKTLKTTQEKS